MESALEESDTFCYETCRTDYLAPKYSDVGGPLYICYLSYTNQLEDYISRYKRRPLDIKHWPYGPYWPRQYEGLLLVSPRHVGACPSEVEPLVTGEFARQMLANCPTTDSQVTIYKGRWRGTQVAYDSERSPREINTLPVLEGCCPTLMFESRFECGNLRQARRVGQFEYELILKSDLYTARHTQWYYFRVTNAVHGITYKIRIINLLKKDSLYNHGMRPLIYSEQDAKEKQRGWVRIGHHISYSRNSTNHNSSLLEKGVAYHTLEWQMEFPNAEDIYYLAHCYPYSFTDLKEDIELLLNSHERSKFTRREVMCETRAGNSCFLLTVTNFDHQEEKKAVVVTARVHPGESQASWMMKGLLEFITGSDPVAQKLRNKFVFKVVPMINPDGVIVGNYRCSLAARDLNRNYRHPRQESFPTIWFIKNMVNDLAKKYEIALYCDLHGHSRKPNVFMYGNNSSADRDNSAHNMAKSFISERLFPWIMSVKSCKFQIRRCKESTGRVVMWRQMQVINSFTMEASFSGTMLDRANCRHFNIHDFMEMGQKLAQAVLEYTILKEDPVQYTQTVADLTRVIAVQVLACKGLLTPGAVLPAHPGSTKGTDEAAQPPGLIASKPGLAWLNNSNLESLTSNAKQKPQDDNIISDEMKSAATSSVHFGGDVIHIMDKLANGHSVDDFFDLLVQLDVQNTLPESDSSDSDSESDPEMKPSELKSRKKRRKSKKQRDKDFKKKIITTEEKKKLDNSRAKPTLPSISATSRKEGNNSAVVYPESSLDWPYKQHQTPTEKGRSSRSVSGFVSKYEGRHNGGLPCFTEERSIERAAQRTAILKQQNKEMDRTSEQSLYYSDEIDIRGDVQDDLNHRLQDFTDENSNINVRTGYTHADNSKEMYTEHIVQLNEARGHRMSAKGVQHIVNAQDVVRFTNEDNNICDNPKDDLYNISLTVKRSPYQQIVNPQSNVESDYPTIPHQYIIPNSSESFIPTTSSVPTSLSTSSATKRFSYDSTPTTFSTSINSLITTTPSAGTTLTSTFAARKGYLLLNEQINDISGNHKARRKESQLEPIRVSQFPVDKHKLIKIPVKMEALTTSNKTTPTIYDTISETHRDSGHHGNNSKQDKMSKLEQLVNHFSQNLSGVASPLHTLKRPSVSRYSQLRALTLASNNGNFMPPLLTPTFMPINQGMVTDNLTQRRCSRNKCDDRFGCEPQGIDQ